MTDTAIQRAPTGMENAPHELGIFTGLTFQEYEAIDALNGSSLLNMRKSPMYYRFIKDNPKEQTEAMLLGTATHRLILEPERVGDFAVWGLNEEEKVRRGKVWEDFKERNSGKLLITAEQRDAMVGMAVTARKNVPIMKYAGAKGACEVTMVWIDPDSGRVFKGRMDKLIAKGDVIFDLKTCRDCSKYRFGAQSYSLGYHIKMALYWQGYKALTGKDAKLVIGAVESKAPHESAVYRITSDVLLQGLEDMDVLIRRLEECERTGLWPAAEPEELELTLPGYAFKEADDLSDLGLVEE